MEKLPIEFKKKWVAALRSGEYKQTKGKLCGETEGVFGYCCLGVGYVVAKGINPFNTSSGYINGNKIDTEGIPQILIGDGHQDSGFGHQHRLELTKMNDSGKSFSEIADYIEANL
jgi:hypothetical protein